MILYFIRHGDPIYVPDSLTKLGQKQAHALSKRLALYGLDEIYTSTSKRAIKTIEPTAKLLNSKPIKLDWTNEKYTWNEFSIKNDKRKWIFQDDSYISLFNSKEIKQLGDSWYLHETLKGYSSLESGIKRIEKETDEFLFNLGYQHDKENGGYIPTKPNKKRIALVAHQGFGLAFLSVLLDIPYPYFSTHFDFSHSSVTAIYFDEDENKKIIVPKVLQLSNDSHLYKENILTGYQNKIDI